MIRSRSFIVTLAFLVAAWIPAIASQAEDASEGYDKLLKAHVDDLGFVDYKALVDAPEALADYVGSLAEMDAVPGADQPEARLATLINAYNAFTLQLILDHVEGGQLPESITGLYGGKPWDQAIWNLAGEVISLNQLEHEIIRQEFPQEPRIHWAVVCAAYSCPPLRAEAYVAEALEEQLADQERRVLLSGDPRFVQQNDSTLNVTKLFEWYGQDFGAWKTYIEQRLSVDQPINGWGFITYDWKLNSQANR